jgi:hypothetical protein
MVDKCQNDQQPTCQNGEGDMPQAIENIGAGEGNRTLVISLEGNQNYNRLNALVDKFPFCVPFDIVQQMARDSLPEKMMHPAHSRNENYGIINRERIALTAP